jgi:hypothetical protein
VKITKTKTKNQNLETEKNIYFLKKLFMVQARPAQLQLYVAHKIQNSTTSRAAAGG